jgi:DNA helicase IV
MKVKHILTIFFCFQEDGEPVDNEFYNFLHVSRTATDEEITAAYKKLTRFNLIHFASTYAKIDFIVHYKKCLKRFFLGSVSVTT